MEIKRTETGSLFDWRPGGGVTTRPHFSQFYCPNCRTLHTAESGFGRWIRNNTELESSAGFCVVDQDYWIHAYKVHENREFQCLMCVEIKTHGGTMTQAQRDTLHVVNQLLRNRQQTPTKKDALAGGSAIRTVHSAMLNRKISLRSFGAYVLTFSGLGPEDSKWMTWGGGDGRSRRKPITQEQLTQLLRFDLDPDTLRPLDLSNHHQTHYQKLLQLPFDAAAS